MRRDDQVLSLLSLKGFLSSKYSRLPDWTLDTLQMLPAGKKRGSHVRPPRASPVALKLLINVLSRRDAKE